MPIRNLDTYTGWITEGRQVRAGEKSASWHEAEDGELSPLFHLDQTDNLTKPDLTLGRVISREERDTMRKPAKAVPRVKLTIDTAGEDGKHRIRVWCGNNTKTIEKLKGAGYRYSGNLHRWLKYVKHPNDVVAGWEQLGYLVELEDKR